MYITSFAKKINFKEKRTDIILAATRLVSRIKRDWLHTDNRPSGLCAAAMLVAARIYGFSCNAHNVIGVLKMEKDSVKKWFTQFGKAHITH